MNQFRYKSMTCDFNKNDDLATFDVYRAFKQRNIK